jgi:hypothetical protein
MSLLHLQSQINFVFIDPQIDEMIIGEVERIPMADFTRIASAGSFQVCFFLTINSSGNVNF